MAVRAEQAAAAVYLTRLFGSTACPDCGADFSVSDQVVVFQT
ncbi:hypothetical protein [Streptomyces sp. NPDC010273]